MMRASVLLVLSAVVVWLVGCGNEQDAVPTPTMTAEIQATSTPVPEPAATPFAGPATGSRYLASLAQGAGTFSIVITSQSTFELGGRSLEIDMAGSCDRPLLPGGGLTVYMPTSEPGAISDGQLAFRGSQPMSVTQQSADYHGNFSATVRGSEGLSISGSFASAMQAEGVLRFSGPAATGSFVPTEGGPPESFTMICDTGDIAWTARPKP